MKTFEATEQAYKNGYEQGKKDALKWIPVSERLPDKDVRVLVWVGDNDCNFPTIDTDRIHGNMWVRWSGYISHWMPLPEPPKGGMIIATCKDCLHIDVCKIYDPVVDFDMDDGVCLHFAKDTNVLTNADRIRAMSDEELCEFLGQYVFHKMCEEGCDACTYNGDCDKRLLEWLQKPAEVE